MGEFSIRRSFGKNKSKLIASNLVEIQKNSYESFLQFGDYSKKRELTGLYAILKEVFEIGDDDKAKNQVEFISYSLDEPALSEEEAVKKDATYSTALKVKLRVIRYEGKGAERVVKEVIMVLDSVSFIERFPISLILSLVYLPRFSLIRS